MSTQLSLSRLQFENALTPEVLRVNQVLQFALMAGSFFFAVIVVLVFLKHPNEVASQPNLDLLTTLSSVTIVLTLLAFVLGNFSFRRYFSQETVLRGYATDDSSQLANRYIQVQRTAILIRFAIIEAASFYGLIVAILAATTGGLASEPKFWFNFTPMGALLVFGIGTFPTKDRLATWFERAIVNA